MRTRQIKIRTDLEAGRETKGVISNKLILFGSKDEVIKQITRG